MIIILNTIDLRAQKITHHWRMLFFAEAAHTLREIHTYTKLLQVLSMTSGDQLTSE